MVLICSSSTMGFVTVIIFISTSVISLINMNESVEENKVLSKISEARTPYGLSVSRVRHMPYKCSKEKLLGESDEELDHDGGVDAQGQSDRDHELSSDL